MVETPGIEPGSEKEIDGTSTCVSERLGLTTGGQFGQPSRGESGASNASDPDIPAHRPVICDVHPDPGQARDPVNGLT